MILALALAPAAAHAQVEAIEPTFQLDAKKDVRGPLDVVRVAMSTRIDGSLRGELTLRKSWDTADVGERGSLCIKLFVKADPASDIPEYLVCATPPREGEALVGRVLRNKANGLPRNVGDVVVSRPSGAHRVPRLRPRGHRPPGQAALRRRDRLARIREVPAYDRLRGPRARTRPTLATSACVATADPDSVCTSGPGCPGRPRNTGAQSPACAASSGV